jgi:hypothetical protein
MHTMRNVLLSGVVFATGDKILGGKPSAAPEVPKDPAPTPNAPVEGGQTEITKADAEAKQEGLMEATGLTVEQAMITNAGIENITANVAKPEPINIQPISYDDSSAVEVPIVFPDGSRSGDPDEFGDVDFGVQEPVAAYKHRTVMRFQVGKFTFQNHILQIFNDADNEEFLRLAQGLTTQDKSQIVGYNWKAAARVERPMDFNPVSRGAVNTKSTKDPKAVQ